MRLAVPPDAAGQRLDAFLAEPLGSRSQAARLIAAGRVRVDGTPAPKRHLVRAGEVVDVEPEEAPAASEPDAAPAPFAVAFEDEHLLVVERSDDRAAKHA